MQSVKYVMYLKLSVGALGDGIAEMILNARGAVDMESAQILLNAKREYLVLQGMPVQGHIGNHIAFDASLGTFTGVFEGMSALILGIMPVEKFEIVYPGVDYINGGARI